MILIVSFSTLFYFLLFIFYSFFRITFYFFFSELLFTFYFFLYLCPIPCVYSNQQSTTFATIVSEALFCLCRGTNIYNSFGV